VTMHSSLGYLKRLRLKADLALVPMTKVVHIAGCRVNNMRMY
jgi:hypothetical protein